MLTRSMIHILRFSGLERGKKDASKHRNARKIPKFWGMRCTKHCNARKMQKIQKFRDLWPSSLHSLQKFGIVGIFQALQFLVHLMPQDFWIFRALQCLVYLRASKHRNVRKIPKFWGMRCTKYCNARKIPKIPKFRDLWPSSLHSWDFFGFFEHYSVWCSSRPKTLGFFEHCSVWCTSEPYKFLLLYDSIALLPYYCFTLLLYYSFTQILCYSITLFISYSFSPLLV